jgi:hypothetical protein
MAPLTVEASFADPGGSAARSAVQALVESLRIDTAVPTSSPTIAQVPTPEPTVANTSVPAVSVDNPRVTVTPSTKLQDGQTVEVTVRGFGVGGKVLLSECASIADATSTGCGPEMAREVFLVTDDNRSGRSAFVVTRDTFVGLPTNETQPCTDRCVIVATIGDGLPFVVAPITFSGP